MTPEYRTKLKAIEWTDSQAIVTALVKAIQLKDALLVDYIFFRIDALVYLESDVLTSNLVLMYKEYLLKLDSNLTPRLAQLEINVDRANRLIYFRMLR